MVLSGKVSRTFGTRSRFLEETGAQMCVLGPFGGQRPSSERANPVDASGARIGIIDPMAR
jgi:hypothetical protein